MPRENEFASPLDRSVMIAAEISTSNPAAAAWGTRRSWTRSTVRLRLRIARASAAIALQRHGAGQGRSTGMKSVKQVSHRLVLAAIEGQTPL
jgi:hypothetical protein